MSSAHDTDPTLIKLILQIIERAGYPHEEVSGLETVIFRSDHRHFFLEDKWPALHKKWDHIQRLKAENYYKYLLQAGVTPGAAVLKELGERKKKAVSKVDSSNDIHEDDTSNDTSDEDSLSAAIEFVSPSSRCSTPTQWPHSARRTSLSLLPSPLKTTARFSPAMEPQKPASVVGGLSSSTGSLSDFHSIEESQENPFRFRINQLFPEKNPFRVEVLRVKKYEHEGFERNVWEFCVTISVQHYDKWEAFFQFPNTIIIKGPSTDYWTKSEIFWKEDCHDYKDKKKYPFPYDPATESANTALELAIEKEPQCEYNWWEIEIPKLKDEDGELTLDNSIFSGSGDGIKKGIRKLKDPQYGLQAVVVYWKIAKVGAIQTKWQNNSIDVKSLLEM